MKNKLTHNLGWKLASILISIALWVLVNAVNDPSISRDFYNIPVELVNTESITDTGRVYEVLDNTDIIPRVTINAPRSVVTNIKTSEIRAVADFDDISKLDTVAISVEVTSSDKNQILSINPSINYVDLNVENKISRTLVIQPEVVGDVSDGYIINAVTLDRNAVRVSGAESKINAIENALVEVDVSGFLTDLSTSAEIRLMDTDGNRVDVSDLSMNIKNVGILIDLMETKTVPVKYEASGQPAPGYMFTGEITSDITEIKVCGDGAGYTSFEELLIPSTALDISGLNDDLVTQVNLKAYLPDGISLMDNTSAVANVIVYIDSQSTKTIELKDNDIIIVNVPDGYKATAALSEGGALNLNGLANTLTGININNINPTVDVTAWMAAQNIEVLEEGFYTINLKFTIPQNVTVADDVPAVVHIVKE